MPTPDGRRSAALERALAIVPPTLAVLAIIALVLLAWNLRGLLILAFVGALIAAALHGPSEWLERRGLPRGLAVVAVYLAIALVIAGLVVLIVSTRRPGGGSCGGPAMIVVQQAEGWLLVPFIQGKVLSLSPVVVLLGVFGGGQLAGIVGAVIAVPMLAVVDVLLRDVVLPLREGRPVGPDPPHDESADDGDSG